MDLSKVIYIIENNLFSFRELLGFIITEKKNFSTLGDNYSSIPKELIEIDNDKFGILNSNFEFDFNQLETKIQFLKKDITFIEKVSHENLDPFKQTNWFVDAEVIEYNDIVFTKWFDCVKNDITALAELKKQNKLNSHIAESFLDTYQIPSFGQSLINILTDLHFKNRPNPLDCSTALNSEYIQDILNRFPRYKASVQIRVSLLEDLIKHIAQFSYPLNQSLGNLKSALSEGYVIDDLEIPKNFSLQEIIHIVENNLFSFRELLGFVILQQHRKEDLENTYSSYKGRFNSNQDIFGILKKDFELNFDLIKVKNGFLTQPLIFRIPKLYSLRNTNTYKDPRPNTYVIEYHDMVFENWFSQIITSISDFISRNPLEKENVILPLGKKLIAILNNILFVDKPNPLKTPTALNNEKIKTILENNRRFYVSSELRLNLLRDFIQFLCNYSEELRAEFEAFVKSEREGNKSNVVEMVQESDLPEIDIKLKDKIRLLHELGVLDFLIKKYPANFKNNNSNLSKIVTYLIDSKTIQPSVNSLLNGMEMEKNYPRLSPYVKSIMDKIESKENK